MRDIDIAALERGDVQSWAALRAAEGDVLPSDNTVLENTFHLARMKAKVDIGLRIKSRDLLKERGVITDYPITIIEQLAVRNDINFCGKTIKETLDEGHDVLLICHNFYTRTRVTIQATEMLRRELDFTKSTLRTWELFTLKGQYIKIALIDEDYQLPLRNLVFKEVASVL